MIVKNVDSSVEVTSKGNIKLNKKINGLLSKTIKKRVSKELGPGSSIRDRIIVENNLEKGETHVVLRKEYLRKKWEDSPKEYEVTWGEVLAVLNEATGEFEGVTQIDIPDTETNEEEGIEFMSSLVNRAIRDVKLNGRRNTSR